jgi:hypothetical protein
VVEEIEGNYIQSSKYAKAHESVGWSSVVISTSRKSIVGSNKVYSQNTRSWICGFGDGQITF